MRASFSFFPSFNVLFVTHDLKKALTYKPAVTTEVVDAAAAGSDALTDCSPFVFFFVLVFFYLCLLFKCYLRAGLICVKWLEM